MSRTDKDAPYWVRAEFYRPCHTCRIQWWSQDARECDLPETPLRQNLGNRPQRNSCTWLPAGWDRKYYTKPPTRKDRRLYLHGPQRRQMRDFCLQVKQEFAATGEVETVEPGRRGSQLDWWD